MECPRCGSRSLMRNHDRVACLACGRQLVEPDREAWDAVALPKRAQPILGPAWTDEERELWRFVSARD